MKGRWFVSWMVLGIATASAHVGDSGIDYESYKDHLGRSCCNHEDCRPVADYIEAIVNGKGVVRLLLDGTWITVPNSYVVGEYATDGRAHWCGQLKKVANSAEPQADTVCVILPPRDT